MAKAYTFSYDLHNVRLTDVWSKIDADIKKQFPDSVKILNTTFVIVTSQTGLQEKLKAIFEKYFVDGNDYEFYFVQSAQSGSGWLFKSKWEALSRILSKVAVYC